MTTRRSTTRLLILSLLYPMAACEAAGNRQGLFMKNEIVLDVVIYSYLARPIFDIYLNNIDLGVTNSYGGTGIITGVTIPLGPQTLTWRLGGPRNMEGNGETVTAKNSLTLTTNKIPPGTHYLGVHIYPDETAELTFAQHMPDTTPRGDKILGERNNGK